MLEQSAPTTGRLFITIMANPKRKHSKARTRKRRSAYYGGLKPPTIDYSEESGSPKLRHRVCPSSGKYRGRQIIQPNEAA